MTSRKKVVLVEDSPIALEILQQLLKSSPEVDLVGTARDGVEGLEVISRTQPDVVCTDLFMENMDGLELTQRVMAESPRPILVISNFVGKKDVENIFRLLQAGALDVFPKPITGSPTDYAKVRDELITKIRILASMKVDANPQKLSAAIESSTSSSFLGTNPQVTNIASSVQVIAIGASTSSLQTIQKILKQLPQNFSLPIICTLHISGGSLPELVNWLRCECHLKVKIAELGETPTPRTVYFAPENSHLELDVQGKFTYVRATVTEKYCPSITVMFKSLAKYYGRAIAAVLLSGLGSDGAEGLQAISQAGGITIAQHETGGGLFGMVKQANSLNAVQHMLGIEEITPFLLQIVSS
ncbi:chemotaxis response regulator protein-glutamate methylesterase [Fischerella thermalis CCMEE 5268]|uniref:protein-glutamate methylesterase n=1 Tax=Fischerella thermalis CCMEE 5268 TaxID=2019662 RepID=A0A2N6KMM2_9CYAN|nr:chemotaxis response regulator protein-glutamate methylesterase [Fischerella thermalis CCMEE 5268]